MKRKLVIVLLAVIALLAAVGAVFYVMMSRPTYKPGTLRGRSDVQAFTNPPPQRVVPEGYWQVDKKTKIYHFSKGKGEPVLVIHGGPGIPPLQSWAALNQMNGYKFYYYHQRGCGKSTRPFDKFESANYYKNMTSLIGELGMEQQLADIERIRKILKADKITLVGHSYGGFIATLYAIEFPGHVKKMVLISPAGVLKLPPDKAGMDVVKKYLSDQGKKDFDAWNKKYFDYGKIFTKDEKELAKLNIEYDKFFVEASQAKGAGVPQHISGELGQVGQIGGWSVHGIYLSLGRTYDYREDLKKITADTLVVYGEKDVYPASISEEYAELIPNAKKKMIPGVGHFAFDEDPEGFAQLLNEFLRER